MSIREYTEAVSARSRRGTGGDMVTSCYLLHSWAPVSKIAETILRKPGIEETRKEEQEQGRKRRPSPTPFGSPLPDSFLPAFLRVSNPLSYYPPDCSCHA
ncbi:MAG: hypothetical protein ACREQ9_18285, partial [Candidatus Binatia bacterium]